MFYLRLLGALLAFVAASVYGVGIALGRRDRSRVAHDYAVRLSRWMQVPLGMRVTVRGEERLRAHRPCVFIGNHQSMLDVPVLARCFAPGSVVIAKQEVGSVPFFGWIYRVTGNLLIDRADTQQSVGRLRVAEDAIRERGVAVHTGAPLVPVVVSPLKPRQDLAGRHLEPAPVVIQVLEAIPTRGLGEADVVPLMERAHARMQAALWEMARELGLPEPPAGPAVAGERDQRGGGSLPGSRTADSGGAS